MAVKRQSFSSAGAAVLLLAALCGGCGAANAGRLSPPRISAASGPEETAGIQVTALHVSGAGRIVDFRFRVVDAGKAGGVLGRRTEAYAVDQSTGTRLPVPRAGKVGALRQTASAAVVGKIYYILFGNTDRVVTSGSRVTVVIGDLRLTDLVVQ